MLDPEFEKNVQKKLEELEFNPSGDVWKKVEEEIQKDKKRRIPLFWIFLLGGLLLGGTYWIFFSQKNANGKNIAVNEVKSEKEKTKAADSQIENKDLIKADKKNENVIQQQALGNEKRNLVTKKSVPFNEESKNEKVKSKKTKAADSRIDNSLVADEIKSKNEKAKSEKNKAADSQIDDSLVADDTKTKNEILGKKNKVADSQIDNSLVADEIKTKSDSLGKENKAADSLSSKKSVAKEIKTKKENRLQLGFTGAIGSSGVNNILGSSYFAPAAYVNSASPPPTVHNPSSIQSDLSFYAGLFLQKLLSKKISLSAGINYHYYSTKIRTGDPGDSVVYVYPSNLNYNLTAAVPQTSYYGSGVTHSYTNHFHFLELPVLMNVQLNSNQKLPITWQAGLSLSYLIYTDALQFDPVSGVYYKNNSLFNKTQVNAITGFSIGFYKKKNLIQVGPEVQYGVTDLMQGYLNTKQHFFYGGLKLSLIPQKK